jgi:microcystin-dependent protein
MAEGWLGEIRLYSYNSLPSGWHLCDGTVLPINQNQALYSLLGTYYGGNGTTNFALPDLRGRVPMHVNSTDASCNQVGKTGGAEGVALTPAQLPPHNHLVNAFSTVGNALNPLNNFPAGVATATAPAMPLCPQIYATPTAPGMALNPASIPAAATAAPHENRQPTMALNWCICTAGVYPNRN